MFGDDVDAASDLLPRSPDEVPPIARRKFQAMSVAYQVLSQARLRAEYDDHGTVCVTVAGSPAATCRSFHSVRWRPFVEEKIITDAHPEEHAHHREAEEAETCRAGDMLDSFDDLLHRRMDSTQDLEESQLHFVERLRENRSLFGTEHQMTVQPIKGDEDAAALHSPCSVMFDHCTGDGHDSILGCGLAESFFGLLGHDDAISVVRAEHGGGRDDEDGNLSDPYVMTPCHHDVMISTAK